MVNTLKVLIAVIVILAIIGIALLGKKVLRALIFKTARTPSKESTWLEIIAALLVVGLSLAHYISQMPETAVTMWIGLVIFFLGGLLQLIARKQLYDDKLFEDRLSSGFDAAQTGFYAKIRHPSKSAMLLMLLGFTFAMDSLWALVLLIVLFFPAVLYRVSQEERALLDKFGDRWMSYQSDTKKLIPGIL